VGVKRLRAYASYRKFVHAEEQETDMPLPKAQEFTDKTPEEIMGALATQLDLQLADDLLEAIITNSPTFFENLVVDLLLKMGYGGFEGSAGRFLVKARRRASSLQQPVLPSLRLNMPNQLSTQKSS
jgi:restriction system protein